jgi:tRNA-Thr(GGU) m(6)t(6)A37 methyltransferase TsaA
MENQFKLRPIGYIHSKLNTREEALNSKTAENVGTLEILPEFEDGLSDLDGFSHIFVVFWLHKAEFKTLKVIPIYFPDKERGIFSTRHPDRPNPIGITVVELLERKGNVLKVRGVDMFEGTPILDIKPYMEKDIKFNAEFGWLAGKRFEK